MVDWNGDGKIDSNDKSISYATYNALMNKAPARHEKPKKEFAFEKLCLIFIAIGAPLAFIASMDTIGIDETLSSTEGIVCGIVTLIEVIILFACVFCGKK